MFEGSSEAPILARKSAKSLPGKKEGPGIHYKGTTLDLDRELRRDWVSDRDLRVKYGRGIEVAVTHFEHLMCIPAPPCPRLPGT